MRYHSPLTFEAASRVAAGASGVTRFLAGGTDVLVQLRAGSVTPDDLIDLKRIPGVGSITREGDGGWTIGAAVSGAALGATPGLVSDWPGVVEGRGLVGSTQVQGRATLAGNLCNGSPAADGVPGLVAAGATATVVGPEGRRRMAIADIPAGPGRTALQPGEVIAAIHLPARGANAGDAYERFIPRTEMDIAVVGCAVSLRLDGDTVAGPGEPGHQLVGVALVLGQHVDEGGLRVAQGDLVEQVAEMLPQFGVHKAVLAQGERGRFDQRGNLGRQVGNQEVACHFGTREQLLEEAVVGGCQLRHAPTAGRAERRTDATSILTSDET